MKLQRTILMTAIFWFVALLLQGKVLAADITKNKNGVEVSPALTDVTLENNKDATVTLHYINHTTQDITLKFKLFNYNQQNITGAAELFNQNSGDKTSILPHIHLTSDILQLPSGSSGDAVLSIQDIKTIAAGGHYVAVVAQVDQSSVNSKSPRVSSSLSSLLLIRKSGGEVFKLSLLALKPEISGVELSYPKLIYLELKNQGNIHLIPYGDFLIKDMFGRVVYKGIINTSSTMIFPGNQRLIPVDLYHVQTSLPFSINTVTIKGHDSLNKAMYSYQKSYTYVNYYLILVMALLIITVVVVYINRIRQKK